MCVCAHMRLHAHAHLLINVNARWLPGEVPAVLLQSFSKVVCHCLISRAEREWWAQGHPAGLMPMAGLDLTISWVLAWCLNHYSTQKLSLSYFAIRLSCLSLPTNFAMLIVGAEPQQCHWLQKTLGYVESFHDGNYLPKCSNFDHANHIKELHPVQITTTSSTSMYAYFGRCIIAEHMQKWTR